jgi:hypothetical protein
LIIEGEVLVNVFTPLIDDEDDEAKIEERESMRDLLLVIAEASARLFLPTTSASFPLS